MKGLVLTLLLTWLCLITCQTKTKTKHIKQLIQIFPTEGAQRNAKPEKPNVVLLLDGSGSINADDWALMQKTAQSFVDAWQASARVSIVNFASGTEVVCDGTCTQKVEVKDKFGKTHQVYPALAALQPRTSTRTDLGLSQASTLLNSRSGPKVIILLTDGQPDDDTQTLTEAQKVKSAGIILIALGFGTVREEFLKRLTDRVAVATSLDSIYQDLVDAFDEQKSALDPSKIFVAANWDPKLSVDPATDEFSFGMVVTNTNEEPIPVGTRFSFNEVRRVEPYTHLIISSYNLKVPIEQDESHEFSVKITSGLYAGEASGFGVIPKNIAFQMEAKKIPFCHGLITLPPTIFSGNVHKKLNNLGRTLNLLLFGPFGAGKSYTANLIVHALSVFKQDTKLKMLFSFCAGVSHCTKNLQVPQVTTLEEVAGRPSLPLKIFDIPGLDVENYGGNYLEHVLDGRVPDGAFGTNGAQLQGTLLPYRGFAHRIHAVVVVVKHDITTFDPKDVMLERLRGFIVGFRQRRLEVVVAVTHMADVEITSWDDKLAAVTRTLGTSPGFAFPIAAYPQSGEVPFETQMQVLDLFSRVISQAKVLYAQHQHEDL